jgi:hypothetical protein
VPIDGSKPLHVLRSHLLRKFNLLKDTLWAWRRYEEYSDVSFVGFESVNQSVCPYCDVRDGWMMDWLIDSMIQWFIRIIRFLSIH